MCIAVFHQEPAQQGKSKAQALGLSQEKKSSMDPVQKDFIFKWTLKDILVQPEGQSVQLKPVSTLIPVIPDLVENPNKREGPLKSFPKIKSLRCTHNQFAFLSESNVVYLIHPTHPPSSKSGCGLECKP
mmetsp:Transcript_8060/g.13536  ORF Transcript_8060/g.13536 Transcript_8060/m.13536 type:complete len:129 (-) Transcript_8060:399-785(-)